MTQSASHSLLVFDSIHYVLAAERAFQQAGLWCDLVPTPRAIHSDCGMVVEFRGADGEAVAGLIPSLPRPPRAAYQLCEGRYEELAW